MFYQQELERVKTELNARYDWNIRAVFEAVDMYGEGVLTPDAIRRYMKVNGYTPTENEVDAIIRRLDSNCDFLLSFNEFIEAFKPRTEV